MENSFESEIRKLSNIIKSKEEELEKLSDNFSKKYSQKISDDTCEINSLNNRILELNKEIVEIKDNHKKQILETVRETVKQTENRIKIKNKTIGYKQLSQMKDLKIKRLQEMIKLLRKNQLVLEKPNKIDESIKEELNF